MNNRLLIIIFFSNFLIGNADYNKELLKAVEINNQAKVVKALNDGANIETAEANSGYTALLIAVANADIDLVKFLLNQGANINVKDARKFTPLHVAIDNVEVGIVKILLENNNIIVSKENLDAARTKAIELTDQLERSKKDNKLYSFYTVLKRGTVEIGNLLIHYFEHQHSLLKTDAVHNLITASDLNEYKHYFKS